MNKDWVDKKEKIGDLNLDLQNPRVPKHIKDENKVESIRNYLIENTDVLKYSRRASPTMAIIVAQLQLCVRKEGSSLF